MAGFKLRRKYVLEFEDDPSLKGFEITCIGLPAGDLIELQRIAERDAKPAERLVMLTGILSRVITNWNAEEDDGTPIPVTPEEIGKLEVDVLAAAVNAYFRAAIGVSRPLGRSLPSGPPSAEVSIPMEPLSASPPNSDTLNTSWD